MSDEELQSQYTDLEEDHLICKKIKEYNKQERKDLLNNLSNFTSGFRKYKSKIEYEMIFNFIQNNTLHPRLLVFFINYLMTYNSFHKGYFYMDFIKYVDITGDENDEHDGYEIMDERKFLVEKLLQEDLQKSILLLVYYDHKEEDGSKSKNWVLVNYVLKEQTTQFFNFGKVLPNEEIQKIIESCFRFLEDYYQFIEIDSTFQYQKISQIEDEENDGGPQAVVQLFKYTGLIENTDLFKWYQKEQLEWIILDLSQQQLNYRKGPQNQDKRRRQQEEQEFKKKREKLTKDLDRIEGEKLEKLKQLEEQIQNNKNYIRQQQNLYIATRPPRSASSNFTIVGDDELDKKYPFYNRMGQINPNDMAGRANIPKIHPDKLFTPLHKKRNLYPSVIQEEREKEYYDESDKILLNKLNKDYPLGPKNVKKLEEDMQQILDFLSNNKPKDIINHSKNVPEMHVMMKHLSQKLEKQYDYNGSSKQPTEKVKELEQQIKYQSKIIEQTKKSLNQKVLQKLSGEDENEELLNYNEPFITQNPQFKNQNIVFKNKFVNLQSQNMNSSQDSNYKPQFVPGFNQTNDFNKLNRPIKSQQSHNSSQASFNQKIDQKYKKQNKYKIKNQGFVSYKDELMQKQEESKVLAKRYNIAVLLKDKHEIQGNIEINQNLFNFFIGFLNEKQQILNSIKYVQNVYSQKERILIMGTRFYFTLTSGQLTGHDLNYEEALLILQDQQKEEYGNNKKFSIFEEFDILLIPIYNYERQREYSLMEVNFKKSTIIYIRPLKREDDDDFDIDEDDLDDTQSISQQQSQSQGRSQTSYLRDSSKDDTSSATSEQFSLDDTMTRRDSTRKGSIQSRRTSFRGRRNSSRQGTNSHYSSNLKLALNKRVQKKSERQKIAQNIFNFLRFAYKRAYNIKQNNKLNFKLGLSDYNIFSNTIDKPKHTGFYILYYINERIFTENVQKKLVEVKAMSKKDRKKALLKGNQNFNKNTPLIMLNSMVDLLQRIGITQNEVKEFSYTLFETKLY